MQKRLNYIDALRGLAILLVVVSHVSNFDFGIKPYDSYWNHFICTFYLPLFFFISGFLAYKEFDNIKQIAHQLYKKFIVLIIPLLSFFCIRGFLNGEINPLKYLFVYDGMIYWFLLVLFEIFATYYVVCILSKLLCKSGNGKKTLCVILLFISAILVMCLVLFRDDSNRFWNVACMENYTKYFQFFSFGVICRAYKQIFHKFVSNNYIKAIVIALFFFSSIAIYWPSIKNNFYIYSAVHDELVRYLGVLTMYIFFYNCRESFDSKGRVQQFLVTAGKNSLEIYLLEGFFHFNLSKYVEQISMGVYNIGLDIVFSVLIAVLIVCICLILSKVLHSSDLLGKILFGRK